MFLTHHAGILLSHPRVGYLYPPPPPLPIAFAPMLSYPTKLLFYDNNNKKVQLNKLPQTAIMFKIIDGTILFNNAKIQIHALGSICVRRDSI